MKIALVHDWFTEYAGAERVVEQILKIIPSADLFSVVDFLPDNKRDFILNKKINTTFIQHLPFSKNKFRNYLMLMPLAIEQFDLSSYDIVISSSHAVAKGVITGPDQIHICICYSPIRYAWDMQHQYLKESKLDKGLKGWITKYMLHKIRMWDYRTSNGVDQFIAISNFIARRIKKVYGRDSLIIYPPVNINDFTLVEKKEDFYLTVSRMVPYKRIDLIAEAFSLKLPDKKLVIIGDGSQMEMVKAVSASNVTLLGYQDNKTVKEYMQKAKAFIFAAEEDFGIAPLEAQACGTPVIAYKKGGAVETVVDLDNTNPTGVFFKEQNIESLSKAVIEFESNIKKISPHNCRENAEKFSEEIFLSNFKNLLDKYLKKDI